MKTHNTQRPVRLALLIGLGAGLSLLVGCASSPTTPEPARPKAPDRDVLSEVRAQGAPVQNEGLEVTPLRDPVITDLLDQASRHEQARQFAAAEKAIGQALTLSPDDPQILQWQAELALAQGHYEQAMRLANSSWEKGPRLGGLCRRNWATIRIAGELTDNPEVAANAAARIGQCTVEAPLRM